MKISAGILYEELREVYAVEAFGAVSYGLSLKNVMFLRAGQPPVSDRVWIADKDARHTAETLAPGYGDGTGGRAASISKAKTGAARKTDQSVNGKEPEGKLSSVVVTKDAAAVIPLAEIFESVFLIRHKDSTSRIHSVIQDVFAKYDYWDADLHRVLTSSSDIPTLIDTGTRIFGNPILLHDINYKTVAASSDYLDEPSLMPLMDDEKLPYLLQSEKNKTVVGTVSGNVMYLRANGMFGVSVNMYRRGKFKYRLMLLELTHEVRAHESALLEHLSDYIRLVLGLVTGGSSAALSITGFMANVLSGEINSREYIAEQMAGFGWNPGDEFVIYRVFTDIHEKNDRTLGFMTTRIADLFDEPCVFEHDDSVVAVFDLTVRGGGDVPIDVTLADFLRDNNLTAGKSDLFTGFEHILQYYAQAGIANRLRPKVKPYNHLCKFRDVVRQFLIESCTEQLPASMVCAPEMLLLKAYDAEHRTEFYHTFAAFLKNDFHAVKAAKEMFLARSTFIYRLERIQEITGLDFNNLSDSWYLLLSMKLIEQAEKQEGK
jgi:hypothetical protein